MIGRAKHVTRKPRRRIATKNRKKGDANGTNVYAQYE